MLITLYDNDISAARLKSITDCLNDDGVLIIPTDTLYAFVCAINSNKGARRVADLKGKKLEKSNFSIICNSLSMASQYAKQITNNQFSFIKNLDTGGFTFVMRAGNKVPKIFQNKKRTIGIRITQNPILCTIIAELNYPLLASSVPHQTENEDEYTNIELIYERYGDKVDIAIESKQEIPNIPSTVLNITEDDSYEIIRQGLGIVKD